MRCDWTGFGDALAQAYFEAAKSGTDMLAAASAFEAVRSACTSGRNVFDVRAAFFDQIGRADLERLAPLLVGLQNSWERVATGQIVASVKDAFARDEKEGWQTWLRLYAQSFDDRAWWKTLACEIALALPSSPSTDWPVQRIQAFTRQVLRGEWSQTFDWIVFLAGQDLLPSSHRAFFLAIAAEIEIYHFARPARALQLLRRADALDAGHTTVCRAWGEYCQLMQDSQGAKERFRDLVARRPDLSDGFIGLAECHDKENEPSLAENFYQQAVARAPGMYDAHYQLLKWYGRPEWFEMREPLFDPIYLRMLKLTDYEPGSAIELGWLYHQNKRYAGARGHFQKAAGLDPGCSRPQVGLAYCDFDEARGGGTDVDRAALLKSARAGFERANAASPEGVEGYWGLSLLAEFEGRQDEVLEWCDRALHCHEGWETSARSRKADFLRQSGALDAAREEIGRATAGDSASLSATESLMSLALAFRDRDDPEAARALLERWREIKGASGESRFQNSVGHLSYRAGNYVEAAKHYRLAVAASPQDDVLHSNLALALENSRQPGRRAEELAEATAALESALKLKPQDTEYRGRLEVLQVERRFVTACGEAALAFDLAVTPIRAELGTDLLPAILDEARTGLSGETLRRAQALREGIQKRFGLLVPGVLFATLPDWPGRDYRIILMEQEEFSGRLFEERTQEKEVLDAVFGRITEILEQRLYRFLGYEETVGLLRGAGDAAQAIIEKPLEVVRLTEALRSVLREGKTIEPIEAAVEEFLRQRAAGAAAPDFAASPLAIGLGVQAAKRAPSQGLSAS